MADIQTNNWSEVASDNTAAPPDGWPEGMARSAVNNAARELMGALKRTYNRAFATRASVTTAQDGGNLAAAYQVDYTVPPPAYAQGLQIAFRADRACGAGPKLRVNTLPQLPLLKAATGGIKPLVRGDIIAGQVVVVSYDIQAAGFIVTSLLAPAAAGGAQVGDLRASAADDPGPGWLACDGRALARSTYAALFAAIGTKYGAGDGSTTFNLPDARGRAVVGAEVMPGGTALPTNALRIGQGTGIAAGWVGGAATHTLTVAEMPSHAHAGSTGTAGAHGHGGFTSGVGDHVHSGWSDAQGQHNHAAWTDWQGDHAHVYFHAGAGGAGFLAGSTAYGLVQDNTNVVGGHVHGVGVDVAGNHAHTIGTYGAGAHSHTISADVQGSHTHAVTISNTGGGAAHNNVQPSLAANVFIFSGVL